MLNTKHAHIQYITYGYVYDATMNKTFKKGIYPALLTSLFWALPPTPLLTRIDKPYLQNREKKDKREGRVITCRFGDSGGLNKIGRQLKRQGHVPFHLLYVSMSTAS